MIPQEDHDRVWNAVNETVTRQFDVAQEAHGERIGDSLLTTGRVDPAASAARPSRRRGFVTMVPIDNGYLLDINVYREFAESGMPMPISARLAGFSGEDEPPSITEWTTTGSGHSEWIPAGRDEKLEGEMFAEVRARLDGDYRPPAEPPVVEPLPLHGRKGVFRRTGIQVWNDYKNYYSWDSLGKLTIGLGVAAVFANTQMDREIAEYDQDHMRNSSTNSFAKMVKPIGDGTNTIPIYIATAVLGDVIFPEYIPRVGEWGNRSLRATAVGFPLMLFLQKATGAERPELDHSSKWTPWKNNHGVSGHAFMGAIPFMVAAQMTDDPYLKAGFYVGSTFTGWSRINDNAHFFSQAMLGWWMAYLATCAVDLTNLEMGNYRVMPMPVGSDGYGIGVEYRR